MDQNWEWRSNGWATIQKIYKHTGSPRVKMSQKVFWTSAFLTQAVYKYLPYR